MDLSSKVSETQQHYQIITRNSTFRQFPINKMNSALGNSPDSQFPYPVYTGLWTNWSHGRISKKHPMTTIEPHRPVSLILDCRRSGCHSHFDAEQCQPSHCLCCFICRFGSQLPVEDYMLRDSRLLLHIRGQGCHSSPTASSSKEQHWPSFQCFHPD